MATFNKKKKFLLVTAAIVLTGGAAAAYWTGGGTGSGVADTGTLAGITVNQTTVLTDMYPGQAAQALAGNFTNSNTGPVYVTQVAVAITGGFSAQADAAKPACTSADFALGQPTATNADVAVGSNQGAWSGATIQLVNRATNQDNCKNLSTVPLTYTSS